VLHSLSFVEDPTRILRAVRFEQRFGFTIEPRTERLIGDALDLLGRVSGERVRHELYLILSEAEPERPLCRLAALGALAAIHPELRCDSWLVEKARDLRLEFEQVREENRQIPPPPMALSSSALPTLMLALLTYRLSKEAATEFAERLRIVKDERKLIVEAQALKARISGLQENQLKASEIVAALDESSDEARLLLRVVSDSWLVRQRLDLYQRRLRHMRPELSGVDLRKMGIPPGRVYGAILDRLRAARLDGEIDSRAQEEALARTLAAGATLLKPTV
jgi:tRNA nucleotidyltransferase (CCA-adding enzyme)